MTDSEGATCDRCGVTEAAVKEATQRLKAALAPHRMNVRLFASALGAEAFRAAPAESNRIWIAETPIEQLLGAKVSMSACTSCGDLCGDDALCRTMTVHGKSHESIPADLIIEAGLVAASGLIRDERPGLGLTYCLE